MISLIGGPLHQWQLDRKCEVIGKDITEVHFCNEHHCHALVEQVVDGMVTIPPVLLQLHQEIEVYGINSNGEEVYSCKWDVYSKAKPKDYSCNDDRGKTSYNDLKDRPCYEEEQREMIIDSYEHTFPLDINKYNGEIEGYESLELNGSTHTDTWVDGEQIYVMWNGVEYVAEPYYNKGGYILYIGEPRIAKIKLPSSSSTNFSISPTVIDNSVKELPVTFSMYRKSTVIKKLDPKFISGSAIILQAAISENDDGAVWEITSEFDFNEILSAIKNGVDVQVHGLVGDITGNANAGKTIIARPIKLYDTFIDFDCGVDGVLGFTMRSSGEITQP